jgi:hypothetical protein
MLIFRKHLELPPSFYIIRKHVHKSAVISLNLILFLSPLENQQEPGENYETH